MDILVIVLILLNAAVGFYRGALRMLFSIFRVALLVVLSYFFAAIIAENLAGSQIYLTICNFLKNIFDNILPGEFSSVEEVLVGVGLLSNKTLATILNTLLKNITFSGSMTFGEIIAPSATNVLLKAVLFILIFVVLSLIFKLFALLKFPSNKLSKVNRVAGFVVGGLKGFLVSMVIFVALSAVASLGVDAVESFVSDGTLPAYLYQNYFLAIFNLFYA